MNEQEQIDQQVKHKNAITMVKMSPIITCTQCKKKLYRPNKSTAMYITKYAKCPDCENVMELDMEMKGSIGGFGTLFFTLIMLVLVMFLFISFYTGWYMYIDFLNINFHTGFLWLTLIALFINYVFKEYKKLADRNKFFGANPDKFREPISWSLEAVANNQWAT